MLGSVLARYGSILGLPKLWAKPSFSSSMIQTCLILGSAGLAVALAVPARPAPSSDRAAAAAAVAAASRPRFLRMCTRLLLAERRRAHANQEPVSGTAWADVGRFAGAAEHAMTPA